MTCYVITITPDTPTGRTAGDPALGRATVRAELDAGRVRVTGIGVRLGAGTGARVSAHTARRLHAALTRRDDGRGSTED
jgi:hypothetical protein